MIQPLRRRHFAIWTVLPALLAILFLAALAARKPTIPANSSVRWEQFK
jgi:hypothetical protein